MPGSLKTKRVPVYETGDEIPVEFSPRGSVLVSSAWVQKDYGDCILVAVEFSSKYAKLLMTGGGPGCGPIVFVGADEDTMHIDERVQRSDPTGIRFVGLDGWDVFSISGPDRDSMYLTLVSPEVHDRG